MKGKKSSDGNDVEDSNLRPRGRCATNAACQAISPATVPQSCARGATDEGTTRISVRLLRGTKTANR